MRWRRWGDPLGATPRPTIPELLAAGTDRSAGPAGCWPWQARVDKDGYGRLALGRRRRTPAHRAAYLEAHGELEPGQVVHHTCGMRLCCNPAHLEAMTQAEHRRVHAC